MGNNVSRRTSCSVVKVVLSSGKVRVQVQSTSVAELMIDHPNECVIELDAWGGAKPSAPLPADRELRPDKAYMMVPMTKRGRNEVSVSADEALAALQRRRRRKRPSPRLVSWGLPMMGCVGDSERGIVEVEREKKLVRREEKTNEMEAAGKQLEEQGLAVVVQGRAELILSRQLSCKWWQPSLDTIEEKGAEKIDRIQHWLFQFYSQTS